MISAVQKTFPGMGTVHSIMIEGCGVLSAADQIKDRLIQMEHLWSVFRQDSEISRLNQSAGQKTMPVSPDTMQILKESVRLSEETAGAFDVTAGALSGLWREAMKTECMPDARMIAEALRHTGSRHIRFSGNGVRIGKEQTIDLGGIAKGYALDRAMEMLSVSGIRTALLNFGGTIGAVGRPIPVGVRNPFKPDGAPIGTLLLSNACAVTSGSYERFARIDGRTVHHIIDPRTGYPSSSGLVSVTLTGTNAARLDAFATGVFILGIDRSLALLKKNGIEAVFITSDGEVLRTEGLSGTFLFHPTVRTA